MVAHHLFGRGRVDAERPHGAVVVDCDVTVLPGDRRELTFDRPPRFPSDRGHICFAHLEMPFDKEPGHSPSFCRRENVVSSRGESVKVWSTTQYRSVRSWRAASCSSLAAGATISQSSRIVSKPTR